MKPAGNSRRLGKRRSCAVTWVALLLVVSNSVLSVVVSEPVPVVPVGVPAALHQDVDPDEDSDEEYIDGAEDDVVRPINITSDEKGTYVGAPCEFTCSPKLLHVYCNPVSGTCECDKKHPVKLNNPYAGCSKPTRLGDQCYYMETCKYTDQHASCIQVHHHAVCQCENGYHSVSIDKPTKKVFCAEDVAVMTSDFSTFAGVLSGIAILSGLICFVLHLFNQNLYETRHHRHRFGNANLAPPILFSSDPGPVLGSFPLPIIERSMTTASSRASSTQRSLVGGAAGRSSASFASRRASSAPGSRTTVAASQSQSRAGAAHAAAILLLSYCPGSALSTADPEPEPQQHLPRYGSRRPSIASVHSSTSVRSYSTRRYERERREKEERELERRFKLAASSAGSVSGLGVGVGVCQPSPSPHSVDDLLPTLEEDRQVRVEEVPPLAAKEESTTSFPEELPSTSKQYP